MQEKITDRWMTEEVMLFVVPKPVSKAGLGVFVVREEAESGGDFV